MSRLEEMRDTVETTRETIEETTLEKELLMLEDWIVEYYRQNVKGNKDMTLLQIRKKLTRNVLSSKESYHIRRKPSLTMYEYGYLRILVEDGNKITWIKNKMTGSPHSIDSSKRKQLNQLFNIKD